MGVDAGYLELEVVEPFVRHELVFKVLLRLERAVTVLERGVARVASFKLLQAF